jgi:hypothetical protein
LVTIEYISAGDISGEKVGSELDALELHPQRNCKRIGDQGLGQAGVVFQQDMTTGREESRHDQMEHSPLSDDRFFNFLNYLSGQSGNLFNAYLG